MTDKKISQLTNITGSQVDDANDELAIVDTSASETKAITVAELSDAVLPQGLDTTDSPEFAGITATEGTFSRLNVDQGLGIIGAEILWPSNKSFPAGWADTQERLLSGTSERAIISNLLFPYAENSLYTDLVADFPSETYASVGPVLGGFSDLITHTRASTATYVDATGTLQTAAVDEPRVGHHIWDGSQWVNEGLLHESEARTNLLLNSDTLATQDVTVTANPHTLHFTGTGTVTLSGASPDGPLEGTGTGENNRVYLTFTPTSGTLTVTVSGTVTNAQLEQAPTPSSYIPTAGSQVTRAADSLTIPAAKLPYPEPVVIGSELVTNGTFDADLTGWTETTSGVVTWDDSGAAKIGDGNGTVNTEFSQTISGLTPGAVYEVSFEITQISGTGVRIYFDGDNLGGGEYFTTSQVFYVVASSSSVDFYVYRFRDHTGEQLIDNVSVKEINPLSLSIAVEGRMTFADDDKANDVLSWSVDGNNNIRLYFTTAGVRTEAWAGFIQEASGVRDTVDFINAYTPGVNVPFSVASRHGSTFLNGAVDGTALTEDTTPTALPDLSTTDLDLGADFMGTIRQFRMWDDDLGDSGLEEASS